MDQRKCEALKRELAGEAEPRVVEIGRFFEGNDDMGSIGCNLIEHPGVEVFREVLVGLTRRPDVEAVYARISELDPGEEYWPFADTVFVVGTISVEELRRLVKLLQPDDVGAGEEYGIPAAIREKYQGPVLAVWWD